MACSLAERRACMNTSSSSICTSKQGSGRNTVPLLPFHAGRTSSMLAASRLIVRSSRGTRFDWRLFALKSKSSSFRGRGFDSPRRDDLAGVDATFVASGVGALRAAVDFFFFTFLTISKFFSSRLASWNSQHPSQFSQSSVINQFMPCVPDNKIAVVLGKLQRRVNVHTRIINPNSEVKNAIRVTGLQLHCRPYPGDRVTFRKAHLYEE